MNDFERVVWFGVKVAAVGVVIWIGFMFAKMWGVYG